MRGASRRGRQGKAGSERRGKARQARQGMVMQGPLRLGWSWHGRRGEVLSWRGLVGLGQARHVPAGVARPVAAQPDSVRHGEAGKARPGEVRSGASRLGGVGYGRARRGTVEIVGRKERYGEL